MSNSLDRICTVDISLASPISNDANFDNILILVLPPQIRLGMYLPSACTTVWRS